MVTCHINTNSENTTFCLCNIYAPNKDTPSFFNYLDELLGEYSEHKIVMGDFNLTMQPNIDRYGPSVKNNDKALSVLKLIVEKYYLTDIWRERHGKELRFSWRRKGKQLQASRIDFALTSYGLHNMVENPTYIASILSDHSAMYIFIKENKK